jgi:hypothetical protein
MVLNMTTSPNINTYWHLLKDLSAEEKLSLVELLVKSIKLPRQKNGSKASPKSAPDREAMVAYILSYENPSPSFGDAGEWQRREREDRELPFRNG